MTDEAVPAIPGRQRRKLPKSSAPKPIKAGRRPSTVVFTIVSANYISFAATLMQSVRRHHPDVARFIILSDAFHAFEGIDLAAELITCDQLGIDLLGNMKLWYSVVEFNTAVKPFTFRAMFSRYGYGAAVYLDPDIQLYAPISHVLDALETHSLVLTPHMTKPLQDGKEPSDLAIMKAGVYNLGFAAVKNDADGSGLIDWWSDRLFAHCRVDIAGNLFTDQRWMDLAPVFVERPFLLRHPGYNAAYWNILHRTVARGGDGAWTVNGLPLHFFHFSGIKVDDPTVFSKHQNRFTMDQLGPVVDLCAEYRTAVAANRWDETSRIKYAYARFRDGRPIEDSMRRWVVRAVDDGRLPKDKPLRLGAAFFDAPEDAAFFDGQQLTRYACQMWRDRSDLQLVFDLHTAAGFTGYLAWFCDGPAEREGAPARCIEAARALRGLTRPAAATAPPMPAPPAWEALATAPWTGPAHHAGEWLLGEAAFTIGDQAVSLPRQAALAWERRTDLQQVFPLTTLQGLDNYLLWALTNGLQEGTMLPDLFSPAFWQSLDTPDPAGPGADVPITRAMMLTARCGYGRDNFQSWPSFPQERRGRLEQAFWLVFVAARAFQWPDAVAASVRAYLQAPSTVAIGQYRFSQGMMAVWEARDDLRATFHLGDEASRWHYLVWLVVQGRREFGVELAELCPGLAGFLFTLSPGLPGLIRLDEFAYHHREDLRAAFDVTSAAGRIGLANWMTAEQDTYLATTGIAAIAGPAAIAAPPVRARVAMTGIWDTQNGIGEDLRSSVAALDACGFTDYVIVNMDAGTILTAGRAVLPAGTPVLVDWNIVHRNADTAMEDWLTLRRMGVQAQRTVGHWHWELERLPSAAAQAFSFYDEIWASSRFAMDAFAAERRRPVRLLNGAVTTPEPSHLVSRVALGLDEAATVFLFMFDFGSYATRKNPHAVIHAFQAAFPEGGEAVQLMIKTQNAKLRPDLWAELSSLTDDPRIIIKDTRLSRDELISLMAKTDAFVSLHRSEGYGRGPAEAMLLGRPVILTGYSGTNDFADASCACMVDYTLVPVQPHEYPGVESQRWAEADLDAAAAYLRWVHQEPEAARAMGERGRARIQAMLAPARIGAAMVAMLDRPVLDAPSPSAPSSPDQQQPGARPIPG